MKRRSIWFISRGFSFHFMQSSLSGLHWDGMARDVEGGWRPRDRAIEHEERQRPVSDWTRGLSSIGTHLSDWLRNSLVSALPPPPSPFPSVPSYSIVFCSLVPSTSHSTLPPPNPFATSCTFRFCSTNFYIR